MLNLTDTEITEIEEMSYRPCSVCGRLFKKNGLVSCERHSFGEVEAKNPVKEFSAAASGTGTQQDSNTAYEVLPEYIIKCKECKGTGRVHIDGGYTYGVDVACNHCAGKGQTDGYGVPINSRPPFYDIPRPTP